jgi:hypothetical protein
MHFTGGGSSQSRPFDPELQERYDRAHSSLASIVKPEHMTSFEEFVGMNNEGAKDEIISAYNDDPMTRRTNVPGQWLDAIMSRAMMRTVSNKGVVFRNIYGNWRGGRKTKGRRRKSSTKVKKGKKTRKMRRSRK